MTFLPATWLGLVLLAQPNLLSGNKRNQDDTNSDSIPPLIISPLPVNYTPISVLPKVMDWRNVNGVNYVTRTLNQHIPQYCGSCWLHASISTLNDRLKIAHHAQAPEINLARQVILNCGDPIAGSCGGGSDYGVYIFAHRYGIPDDSCQLYSAEDYQCTPFMNCMNCDPVQGKPAGTCYPVQRYNRYFVTEYSKMAFPSIHEMKAEIFRRGPISCSIDSSFVENGKYHPGDIVNVTGKVWDLDHDISVAGWSVDPDTGAEYWIVRNSWGTFWGDEGWMKVALGHNVMGIESDCAWAVIEGTPVKRNWGPSDVDRMFPSGFEKPDEERNPFTHKRFDFSNYFATGETEGPKKKRSKVSAFSNTTAAVAESLDNSPLWN